MSRLRNWLASLRWYQSLPLSVAWGGVVGGVIWSLPTWFGVAVDAALLFWCGYAVAAWRISAVRLREGREELTKLNRIRAEMERLFSELIAEAQANGLPLPREQKQDAKELN